MVFLIKISIIRIFLLLLNYRGKIYIYIYIYVNLFLQIVYICFLKLYFLKYNHTLTVKDLVVELTPPHAQSVWGSRGERVRTAGLEACCNYFSKKQIYKHDDESKVIARDGIYKSCSYIVAIKKHMQK